MRAHDKPTESPRSNKKTTLPIPCPQVHAQAAYNEGMQQLLTARELSKLLRVAPGTVRRWARAGLIPCIQLPRFGLRFDYARVRRRLATGRGTVAESARA
jgi:hypothetical protein